MVWQGSVEEFDTTGEHNGLKFAPVLTWKSACWTWKSGLWGTAEASGTTGKCLLLQLRSLRVRAVGMGGASSCGWEGTVVEFVTMGGRSAAAFACTAAGHRADLVGRS